MFVASDRSRDASRGPRRTRRASRSRVAAVTVVVRSGYLQSSQNVLDRVVWFMGIVTICIVNKLKYILLLYDNI